MNRSTRARSNRPALPRIELSAVLIARDEAVHIADLAESLDGVIDEVVLLDTGSTDDTVELAKSAGFRVFHRPWTDSFADARNAALGHARGRWALWIDADERLATTSRDDLRALIGVLSQAKGGDKADGFWLGVDCFNSDDLDPLTVSRYQQVRLFRRERFHFEGRIHEQLAIGPGERAPLFLRAPQSLRIRHLGYTPAVWAGKQKAARNLDLLEASLRDAVLGNSAGPEAGNRDRIAELTYEKARLGVADREGVDALVHAVAELPHDSARRQHGTVLATAALIRAGRHDEALRSICTTVPAPEWATSFAVLEATALARLGRDGEAAQLLDRIEAMRDQYSSEVDLFVRAPALKAEILAISGEPGASWRALIALLDHPAIDLAPTAVGIAERSWKRAVLAGTPDSYLAELSDLTDDEFAQITGVLPEAHQRAAAAIRHLRTRGPITEPDPRLAAFLPRLLDHSPASGLEIARARLDTEPALALGIAEATSRRADATAAEVDAARVLAIRASLLLGHVEQAVTDATALGADSRRPIEEETLRGALAAMGQAVYAAPAARRAAPESSLVM